MIGPRPGRVTTRLAAAWQHKRGAVSALALTTAFLAGCVPEMSARAVPLTTESLASGQSLATPAGSWPADQWWKAYGDAQLDQLEQQALAGTPDLGAADARFRRAATAARERGASLLPELSANGRPDVLRQTLNQGFPESIKAYLPDGIHSQGRATVDLAWDVDLFGRNRAAIAAARSQAEAAAYDAATVRLFLSTAVAASYVELQRLLGIRAAAADALAVRQNTLALIARRFAQGLATRVDERQQATAASAAQGEVAAIDGQIMRVRHQIAALLGAGPDRGLAITPPSAAASPVRGVPSTLHLDLVGRRPDLAAARARVEAAGNRIDEAKAEFYPNVNLVAFAGVQSFGIADLFTHDALAASAGPAINLPIFSGGRLRARYKGARAGYDEAVATYDGLLVNALRDVADIVTDQRALRDRVDAAESARASAAAAYDGVKRRYSAGLSSYLEVLTSESSLIERRRVVADLNAQFLSLDIALVRALGGGFGADREPTIQGQDHG
jgi:NodT family efflux transporter outer membrane factor (OMF) lipoprotein